MPRRSIEIESFKHVNPIPGASRVGPLVVSSVIVGRNPDGELPEDPDAQIANLFRYVGDMLAAAGAEWRHVAKMNFFVPSLKLRDSINKPWAEHFPDPESRPARHTQIATGGGSAISCDFLAYVED
jgi:2-iminobutanoate/2-iminopropanoate deaminase